MRKQLRKKKLLKMWDYWSMANLEIISLTPKVPYILTPEQIEGYEQMWKASNIKNQSHLYAGAPNQGPLFYFSVGVIWTICAEAVIWLLYFKEIL